MKNSDKHPSEQLFPPQRQKGGQSRAGVKLALQREGKAVLTKQGLVPGGPLRKPSLRSPERPASPACLSGSHRPGLLPSAPASFPERPLAAAPSAGWPGRQPAPAGPCPGPGRSQRWPCGNGGEGRIRKLSSSSADAPHLLPASSVLGDPSGSSSHQQRPSTGACESPYSEPSLS